MPKLTLLTLKCEQQEDYTGDDSAYITINNEKFWGPKQMDDGQRRTINKEHIFSHRAEIRLYDEDSPDDDDFLGSYTVTRADIGVGEKKISFTEDDSSYVLWIIVEDGRLKNSEVEGTIDGLEG